MYGSMLKNNFRRHLKKSQVMCFWSPGDGGPGADKAGQWQTEEREALQLWLWARNRCPGRPIGHQLESHGRREWEGLPPPRVHPYNCGSKNSTESVTVD